MRARRRPESLLWHEAPSEGSRAASTPAGASGPTLEPLTALGYPPNFHDHIQRITSC